MTYLLAAVTNFLSRHIYLSNIPLSFILCLFVYFFSHFLFLCALNPLAETHYKRQYEGVSSSCSTQGKIQMQLMRQNFENLVDNKDFLFSHLKYHQGTYILYSPHPMVMPLSQTVLLPYKHWLGLSSWSGNYQVLLCHRCFLDWMSQWRCNNL